MAIIIPGPPQVQQSPLQLPRAPGQIEGEAGHLNAASQQALRAAQVIALDQQRKQNVANVNQAMADTLDAVRVQETEWKERRGVGALDLNKTAQGWWDKTPAEIGKRYLTNPAQQQLYAQEVQNLRARSLDGVAAHVSRESTQAVFDTQDAKVSGLINQAAQNVGNPDEVASARTELIKTVSATAVLAGMSQDKAKEYARGNLTKFHVSVIENLVGDSPENARAYYEAYKSRGEIDGGAYKGIEGILKSGDGRKRSYALVDEARAKGLSGSRAMDYIAKHAKDADDRAMAEGIQRSYDADAQRAENEFLQDLGVRAERVYGARNRLADVYADPKLLRQLELHRPDVLRALRQRGDTPQDAVATDWERYDALGAKVDNATAEELRTMDFAADQDKLNGRQLDDLQKRRDSRIKALTTGDRDTVATREQILSAAIAQDKQMTKDKQLAGLFRQRVNESLYAQQKAGVALNDETIGKTVSKLLTEMVRPRAYWSAEKLPAYRVIGLPNADDFHVSVSDDARELAIELLKGKKVNPTPEAVNSLLGNMAATGDLEEFEKTAAQEAYARKRTKGGAAKIVEPEVDPATGLPR